MNLLLDTHALLWWLSDDARLGSKARELIEDPANTICVSMVSLWEIMVKVRVGKLEADIDEIISAIDQQGFEMLDIRIEHIRQLALLPMHHRDPFDHLLMVQSTVEGLTFLTEDRHVPAYGIPFVSCSTSA